jgi:hypothetical protein
MDLASPRIPIWRIGQIGILRANRCTLEDSYWLLFWKTFTIRTMSADQYKQIRIMLQAISFNMRTGFNKQNGSFEKSHELKGQNLKKP